jgi:hypothetical protein
MENLMVLVRSYFLSHAGDALVLKCGFNSEIQASFMKTPPESEARSRPAATFKSVGD